MNANLPKYMSIKDFCISGPKTVGISRLGQQEAGRLIPK